MGASREITRVTRVEPRPGTWPEGGGVLHVPPEVGTRLANRYRLEECLDKHNGTSSWRAIDEKLDRAVGIHMIPAEHALAEEVVAAARAAAMLAEGRFARVLDALRRDDTVHVVYEWVPHARSLGQRLHADGPLAPLDAQLLITEAAEAVSAAHTAGLAHLRLQADTVLCTDTGQVKILELCVGAALHGTTAEDPASADARGLGRILYAALTAKWPDGEAFGLPAAPYDHDGLCTPRQVRAGISDELDSIVDRTLSATPRTGRPLRTPGEVAAALRELPRPRPPAAGPTPEVHDRPAGRLPGGGEPPTEVGRRPTGAARGIRLAVAGVFAAGLILLGWQTFQVVDLGSVNDRPADAPTPLGVIPIAGAGDFDPFGNGKEKPQLVDNAVDGDEDTAWRTLNYTTASLGNLKPGVGLIIDLGAPNTVREVKLRMVGQGGTIQLGAAPVTAITAPGDPGSYPLAAVKTNWKTEERIRLGFAIETRFLLVWLTELPEDPDGGFRGGIAEVEVRG